MFNNKSNSKDIIDKLFKDGIIKIENIFEEDFLKSLMNSKDAIFKEYPFGQDENCLPRKNKFSKRGDHPIRNLSKLDKKFLKIIDNDLIKDVSTEILGSEFKITNLSMRKIPKTDYIMHTHRDFCGGLSFSLLLDDISLDQGETFFYEGTYKYPPPNFCKKNESLKKISTIGNAGDLYLWFPDMWHGRNLNFSNKETCILMGDLENFNSNKSSLVKEDKEVKDNSSFLGGLFKKIGNQPNGLISNLTYCYLRYKLKLTKKIINRHNIIFTRQDAREETLNYFSIIDYLKKFQFTKL